MASVLQVEELRGSTTGANANKIIIPSGQTLDIQDGVQKTNLPDSTVINSVLYRQTVHEAIAGQSNSFSFVDYTTSFQNVSITALTDNPTIRLEGVIYYGTNGDANPYILNRWYHNVNGGSYSWFNSFEEGGAALECDMFYGGSATRDVDYLGGAYRTTPIAFVKEGTVTCSAGDLINFKLTFCANEYCDHRINRANSPDPAFPVYGGYLASHVYIQEIAG